MPIQIDFAILNEVINEEEIDKIQNIFDVLVSDLSEYLGLQPVDERSKVQIAPEVSEQLRKDLHILDRGVSRRYQDNSLIIEIYEKNSNFLPFILLRETYYCFLPKEVKENEMIKIYINQIIENHLETFNGFREWHNIT
ncbi:MAG: hypothetical protein ACW96S_11650, partial [Promethearchaeota archaeon]